MSEGKQKRRGIGSISQFATLGNAKTPERPSTEDPKSQDVIDLSSPDALTPGSLVNQESKNLNAQDTKHLNVEVSENQVAQEPNRLIQVSEEELKRLMVEALQSQNVKAPEPEKPKRLRQTVYLEPDLHKKVRHRIADTGEDISDVVNLALRQLLED